MQRCQRSAMLSEDMSGQSLPDRHHAHKRRVKMKVQVGEGGGVVQVIACLSSAD